MVESRSQKPVELKEALRQVVNEQLQLHVSEVVIAAPGSLPKTSSGKIQRAKTRQQYLDNALTVGASKVATAGEDRAVVAKHVALSLVGRARHRAKRALHHTTEIRSISDAVEKLRLVSDYAKGRVTRLFN